MAVAAAWREADPPRCVSAPPKPPATWSSAPSPSDTVRAAAAAPPAATCADAARWPASLDSSSAALFAAPLPRSLRPANPFVPIAGRVSSHPAQGYRARRAAHPLPDGAAALPDRRQWRSERGPGRGAPRTLGPRAGGTFAKLERHSAGRFRRGHRQGADSRLGKVHAQPFVQKLVQKLRPPCHPAHLCQQKLRLGKPQPLRQHHRDAGQFVSRCPQNPLGCCVSGFGQRRHHRKHPGKHFVGCRLRARLHLGPVRAAQLPQQPLAQFRILAGAVLFPHRRQHRAPSDFVRTAFIANLRSVSTRARRLAFRVSPNRAGAGSCNQHQRRTSSRRRQRQIQIRADLQRNTGKFRRQQAPHLLRRFRWSRARKPRANPRKLRPLRSSPSQRAVRRFSNRRQRAAEPHSQRIRWSGLRFRRNRPGLAHQHGVRFRSAAVQSQKELHLQSIRENCAPVTRFRALRRHTATASICVLGVHGPGACLQPASNCNRERRRLMGSAALAPSTLETSDLHASCPALARISVNPMPCHVPPPPARGIPVLASSRRARCGSAPNHTAKHTSPKQQGASARRKSASVSCPARPFPYRTPAPPGKTGCPRKAPRLSETRQSLPAAFPSARTQTPATNAHTESAPPFRWPSSAVRWPRRIYEPSRVQRPIPHSSAATPGPAPRLVVSARCSLGTFPPAADTRYTTGALWRWPAPAAALSQIPGPRRASPSPAPPSPPPASHAPRQAPDPGPMPSTPPPWLSDRNLQRASRHSPAKCCTPRPIPHAPRHSSGLLGWTA